MNELFLTLITCLMFYVTFSIHSQLALTFYRSFSIPKTGPAPGPDRLAIALISKICLSASVAVVFICSGVLRLLNLISFVLGLIGSLLITIAITPGSIVMACPFFLKPGYGIPSKLSGYSWMLLNRLELVFPILVLIILKASKFSLLKYPQALTKRNFMLYGLKNCNVFRPL